ncbi:MAG: hypothetical protein HRU19_07750 [Pseudobacteriovorax sp.]|nr:hypothetical protein [Pseudobacteriovorax sp.]
MIWISHRGYCEGVVENTRKAFRQAIDAGFVSLETDLRCTADGHIVLHHDRSMERTAERSVNIDEMTLEAFKQTVLKDGQNGMTFLEFIEEFAGCNWILDIKPETARRVIRVLRDWSDKQGAASWIQSQARFLVWSKRDAKYLRRLFPNSVLLARQSECVTLGLFALASLERLVPVSPNKTYSIPPRFFGINLYKRDFVSRYHKLGAKVLAYLPATAQEVEAAKNSGCDEILTNGLIS